jgi:hypothetical protein
MAWLFVPGLAGLNSVSNSYSPITVPSLTWRGKPLPPRRWSRVWQTARFIRRLSGTTYSPSMADAGVDAYLSSLPASPANRGAQQASDSASLTRDGFGMISFASFAKWSLTASSWRMCLPLFPEADWPLFSGTWPTSGSMRTGICSASPMFADPTGATASSSWPTATESDSRSSARHTTETGVMHPSTMLTDAVRAWPTPTVRDNDRGDDGEANREGSPSLVGATSLFHWESAWPTPAARDYKSENSAAHLTNGTGRTHLDQLPNFVAHRWATPRAEDSENCGNHPGAHDSLTGQTKLWNTPRATEADGGRRTEDGKRSVGLNTQAEMSTWSTPRVACNVTGTKTRLPFAEGGKTSKPSLEDQAREMWPTPTAEPYGSSQNGINGIGGAHERPSANTPSLEECSHSFPLLRATSPDGDGSSASTQTSHQRLLKPRLNPRFVEWLMGLPPGWTDSAPVGTAFVHWQQRMRWSLWQLVPACS